MAGLFLLSRRLFQGLLLRSTYTPTYVVRAFLTTTISATRSSFDFESFVHPTLTPLEHQRGTRLGIDSWADTNCAGKHAFVEEFVVDKFVTAGGFSASLGTIPDLPIANVLYAYDADDSKTYIIECKTPYI